MRKFLVAGALAGVLAGFADQASAVPVDVELQLLVDISASVDSTEFAAQRDGYVAAFQSAAVQNAILGGPIGAVAVQFIYWSGNVSTSPIAPVIAVDWTLIESAADANAFAAAVSSFARPSVGQYTGIGEAINFGVPLFASNNYEGSRQVIDVSSDGKQNTRTSNLADTGAAANLNYVQDARDDALAAGIDQINAIVIGTTGTPSTTDFLEADLTQYFTANVIGGDDAFVLGLTGFDPFETQIATKLTTEITNGDVPLPGSLLLLLGALGGLGVVGRRARKAA